MEYSIEVLFLDLMKASILILIAHIIRSKVKFIQNLYIPSSLLAGFLGLALGPYGVNYLTFSNKASGYSSAFMVIVFSAIAYGSFSLVKHNKNENKENLKSFKGEALKRILALYVYRSIVSIVVYIVPIIIGIYVINRFQLLPEGFTILVGGGFVGGHGTNAAFSSVITQNTGWLDANDIGMTFATIGILLGLIGGIIQIKIATNRKYTYFINKFESLPQQYKTGFLEENERIPLAETTVSSIALDPLAWNFIMVMIPTGLAYATIGHVRKIFETVPTYLWAFLIAILLIQILKITNLGKYVDKNCIQRISSTATEYLVFFGVAGIKISIVIEFAMPIIILSIVALISLLIFMYTLAPRLNNYYWFERSIFVYGYCTGVYAIGLTLLRIVDPNSKSKTLEDAALTSPIDFVEYYTLLLGPVLMSTGKVNTFLSVMIIMLIVSFIVAFVLKLWNTPHLERKTDSELC